MSDRAAKVAILAAVGWAIVVLAATVLLPLVTVAGPRTDSNEHFTLLAYAGWSVALATGGLVGVAGFLTYFIGLFIAPHRRPSDLRDVDPLPTTTATSRVPCPLSGAE